MANPYPALMTDANSETRVAGQITFTDPANQPGGGASVVRTATVTLDQAQILDLANTPVTVVAAAGSGTAIIPMLATYVKTGTGLYGAAGKIVLALDALNIYNQMTNGVPFQPVLNSATATIGVDSGPAIETPATVRPVGQSYTFGDVSAGYDNADLSVSLLSGTPSGGDAGDTLRVSVYYVLANVA